MRLLENLARRASLIMFVLVAITAGAPTAVHTQGQLLDVAVFGDSLSDPGNIFAFTHTNSVPPDYSLDAFLVPGAAYARGGHHLTNGPTWIEQLGQALGANGSVQPAFVGSNPFATNFAVAIGRARDVAGNPGLTFQVAAYLQKTGGASADALYVVEMGGNDVRDALATGDPAQAAAILQSAAGSIASNIGTLYGAGARRFLVWNVPDIGATPAVHIADALVPGTAAAATQLTNLYNNVYLPSALAPVFSLPGITIVPFDANALITSIVTTPAQFGLTNVTDPCVTPDVPPFTCQTPDEYLFWDGIHPTRAVHAIVAETVGTLLGI